MRDYIMDMIEDFGEVLSVFKAKTTHNEDFSVVNHDAELGDAGLLGIMLKRMCMGGKINDAENMLFDALEEHPEPDYFFVALDFYKELSSFTDEKLKEFNFSRQEIEEGISDVIDKAKENGISADQL